MSLNDFEINFKSPEYQKSRSQNDLEYQKSLSQNDLDNKLVKCTKFEAFIFDSFQVMED